jgi:hypothetical protein
MGEVIIFRNLKIGLENSVQCWGYLDEWGNCAKGMGRFSGISSSFRNFLESFLCRENIFLALCVHCPCVLSKFPTCSALRT